MPEYWMVLTAILLGLIVSFLVPYFSKKWTGKITELDFKYIYHTVGAAVWEFVVSISLYASFEPPAGVENDIVILFVAFLFGFGGPELQKRIESLIGAINVKRNGQ